MRTELADRIERHEDTVHELRRAITATRDEAAGIRNAGLVELDLERALVSLDTIARDLLRAHREAER